MMDHTSIRERRAEVLFILYEKSGGSLQVFFVLEEEAEEQGYSIEDFAAIISNLEGIGYVRASQRSINGLPLMFCLTTKGVIEAEKFYQDNLALDRKPAHDDIDMARLVPQTKKVFIVHGHDEQNQYRLRDLLERHFGLEPVILKYQPGKGRTLIKKFEDEASNCSFAFVLLTPDDEITKDNSQYRQARPNVIFELGWFYGRLGRDRVTLLLHKDANIHSDLDGISRIEFTDSIEEKVLEIERELKAAKVL